MIHVITGAPCSGKSTYARENAQPGDVVVDFDAIADALGNPTPYEPPENIRKCALAAREAVIDACIDGDMESWIIHTNPSDAQRAAYMDAGAEFVEMGTDMETCLERAEADGRPERTAQSIIEWFQGQKGSNMELQYKSFEITEDGGEIVAYAATFDREPDAYGDVIRKGAFTRSLKEWKESGKPIPLLYGHNAEDPRYNIGACVEAIEDDHGLLIRAGFDPDNELAQYVRKLVDEGRVCKMSFAFMVRDHATVELDGGFKANELRDVDIFEVSVVLIPANQNAVILETRDTEPEQKSGRRNSAADEQRIRDAIATLQSLLDDIEEPEEPEQVNAAAEEPAEVNGSKALLEIIEKIGGTDV